MCRASESEGTQDGANDEMIHLETAVKLSFSVEMLLRDVSVGKDKISVPAVGRVREAMDTSDKSLFVRNGRVN